MEEKVNKKFNFNKNLTLIFSGLTFTLMLMCFGDILSKNFLSTGACLFLILSIGVSHGALDDIKGYRVLRFYKIKNKPSKIFFKRILDNLGASVFKL